MPGTTRVRSKKRRVIFVPRGSVHRRHEACPTQSTVGSLKHQILSLPPTVVQRGLLTFNDSSHTIRSASGTIAQPTPAMATDGSSALPTVPDLFNTWPLIRDELETETSEAQDETVEECLPFLIGSTESPVQRDDYGLPNLAREDHISFLHRCLGTLPAGYVSFDAARPWLVYWVLTALSLLEEDVQQYRER